MPRDGSGNFSLPANTLAVTGDPISSTKFNTLVQDIESDLNVDRPVAAGGTGASTAAGARTNLGLVIGTDVQAFDAGLLSIAGLTTAADRSIYTTALDTYAVYTLTAAGRAILDDADAAAQRTTLGLVIGTDVQAYDAGLQSIAGLTTAADTMIYTTALDTYATTSLTSFARTILDDANQGAVQTTIGYTAADVLTKLLTVDGAGSNLDADTLDGVQGSAFGQLAGTQTWTNANTFSLADPIRLSAAAGTLRRILFQTSGTLRWAMGAENTAESGSNAGSDFVLLARNDAGSAIGTALSITRSTMAAVFGGPLSCGTSNAFTCGTIELGNASDTTLSRVSAGVVAIEGVNIVTESATQTLTNKTLTSPTINGAALSGTLSGTPTFSGAVVLSGSPTLTTPTINGGTIQSRVQASSETTGTLTSASANKTIQATGDITINNSVFSAGDLVLYYAGASARSITAGTISTMRLAGTATTGTRSVAARGVAMLFFVSATEVVVGGPGVT